MKTKLLLATSALVGMLALTTVASATPAVTDGAFSNGLTGWTTTGSGTTPGIGITVINTGGSNSTGYGDNVPTYLGTTNAAYFVDDNASESLYQLINLSANTSYTLSYGLFATQSGQNNPNLFIFDSTVYPAATNSSLVFVNSANTTGVPVGAWTTESITFTTTSATSYLLDFGFGSGADPAKDVLLADVAIPEPISSAMFGAGVLGLGLIRRMKKAV